jgi:hypothetical protein
MTPITRLNKNERMQLKRKPKLIARKLSMHNGVLQPN